MGRKPKKIRSPWQANFRAYFKRLRVHGIITGILAIYIIMSSCQVSLPGFYYDEARLVNHALSYLDNIKYTGIKGYKFIGGRIYPTMLRKYCGSLKAYLIAPLIKIAGRSLYVYRGSAILFTVIGLVFMFLALKHWLGILPASLAMLLLVLDPSFIYFSSRDFGPSALMFMFKGLLFFFIVLWSNSFHLISLKSYKPTRITLIYSLVIGLIAGLGFYNKANFLWLMIAIAVAAILFYRKELLSKLKPVPLLLFIIAFLLSGWQMIQFNLFIAPENMVQEAIERSVSKGLFQNLVSRIKQFEQTISGTISGKLFFGEQWTHRNIVMVMFFTVFSIAALVYKYIYRQNSEQSTQISISITVIAIVILLSILTPTDLSPQHQLIHYPFPHLVVAVGISFFLKLNVKSLKNHGAPVAVLLMAIIFNSIYLNANYIGELERTGGRGNWSDAIYDLTDWLLLNNLAAVCVDWGFEESLIALGGGRIKTAEISYNPSKRKLLFFAKRSSNFVFVCHSKGKRNFEDNVELFFKNARELNMPLAPVRVFAERDKTPVISVYRLVRSYSKSRSSSAMK